MIIDEKKPRILKPEITLDSDFMKLLAMEYVPRLKHFKGKNLQARGELLYNEDFTGGVIVSIQDEGDVE